MFAEIAKAPAGVVVPIPILPSDVSVVVAVLPKYELLKTARGDDVAAVI